MTVCSAECTPAHGHALDTYSNPPACASLAAIDDRPGTPPAGQPNSEDYDATSPAKFASLLLSIARQSSSGFSSGARSLQESPQRAGPVARPASVVPAAPSERSALGGLLRSEQRTDSAPAFAKLQGRGWEFFLRSTELTLGRGPDTPGGDSPDVFLGPGVTGGISRRHLRIEYVPACEAARRAPRAAHTAHGHWALFCMGRSGVSVSGVRHEPFCQPVVLSHRALIAVDGVEFFFVLPSASPLASPASDPVLGRMYASTIPAPLGRPAKRAAPGHTGSAKMRRLCPPAQPLDCENSAFSVNSTPRAAPETCDIADATKPPYSYARLIAEAITSVSPRREEQKLTLAGIYAYLSEKYPYFRYTRSGWQNSIRHNLSLNKAFAKVPRRPGDVGKGMFWIIDPTWELPPNSSSGPVLRSSVVAQATRSSMAGAVPAVQHRPVAPDTRPDAEVHIAGHGLPTIKAHDTFGPVLPPLCLMSPGTAPASVLRPLFHNDSGASSALGAGIPLASISPLIAPPNACLPRLPPISIAAPMRRVLNDNTSGINCISDDTRL